MPFFGLMRASARALGRLPALLAACSVCCTWALLASAGPMDPSLARLVVDPSCQADGAEVACVPDRAAYTKLVSQLGAALARLSELGILTLTSQPPTLEELFLRHYGDELAEAGLEREP